MIRSITDTNVFSRIFAGEATVKAFVETAETSIDVTIFIECIQGSKSPSEKKTIRNYLLNFPLIMNTPQSSRIAIELIEKYSNSHGLLLPDAMIAASALENRIVLYTHNISDFRFIEGLECLEPPV